MDPQPKRTLKQQIADAKMDRRVGKYTSDPDNASKGIFLAPKEEQKEFRKNITQKIKALRKQK